MDESDGVLFHHLLDLAELPRAQEEDANALGSQLTSQDSGSWSEFMDSSFTEYLDNMDVNVREVCPLDAMRAMCPSKPGAGGASKVEQAEPAASNVERAAAGAGCAPSEPGAGCTCNVERAEAGAGCASNVGGATPSSSRIISTPCEKESVAAVCEACRAVCSGAGIHVSASPSEGRPRGVPGSESPASSSGSASCKGEAVDHEQRGPSARCT